MTHADLVQRAARWLKNRGCGVVFHDGFCPVTANGEQPDAIGFRDGLSILVEAKVSRADFLKDGKKRFRQHPEEGMGNWRFFLCPAGMIGDDELPQGWGLLHATPKTIRQVVGPKGNVSWYHAPFRTVCERSEKMMLISACRRMEVRGHLKEIYDGVPAVARPRTATAADLGVADG